jgi:MFS family permease
MFASFAMPSYRTLWLSGWCWTATRQLSVFLGAYLTDDLTGSPLQVQLVGTFFFLPMFVGGILAGVVSDRFDRRRTMLRQLVVLAPLAVAMGLVSGGGRLEVWMVYLFMLAVGIGGVIDMTSRRALVIDVVGIGLATNAVALEAFALSSGSMLGTLAGGAILRWVGPGQTYFLIAALYLVSALLLRRVQPPARDAPTGPAPGLADLLADFVEGVRMLRTERPLASLLGVTVLMNFCFFSYTPLVAVFARRLEVDAFLAGMLAAAGGLGMMAGSLAVARLRPQRRGLLYLGSTLGAMLVLNAFGHAPNYVLAFAALTAANLVAGGFASTQGSIAMSVVSERVRGRAMGLVSMAIGALPFGMFVLGLLAQRLGPPAAITALTVGGIAATIAWNLWRPELRNVR